MSKTQNITISNETSKIFICNTTTSDSHEENTKKCINDATSSSSITILTPDLQIQINNSSYKDSKVNNNETTSKKQQQHHSFDVDEEVFMECDGKFYLGTVISSKAEDYLIKFDDNTEKWSNQCKLKKLTASPTKNGNDSLCVVCKISNDYDVVEICDKCSRGYHRQCIKLHSSNDSPRWNCTRCSYDVISISDSEDLESISAVSAADEAHNNNNNNNNNQTTMTKLSYNLNNLKWDAAHRTNKENKYCYCGLNGVWKEKMFQCCRCHQWFHEKCVKIWNGNLLLNGDTFFIFCCSICNDGNEFIRRIHMNMRDIIHLVLYELTVTRGQRFHSISRDVVPFIWQNWNKLVLPIELMKFKSSKTALEKKVIQVVKSKLDELFKCVVGTKKKGCLYGLKKRAPPTYHHLQKVRIPSSGPFTDDLIRKLKIKFVEVVVKTEEELAPKAEVVEAKRQLDFDICDSSDDTSSKSTLDLIIPRPDNFKGFNNPFHINYRSDVKMIKNMEKINGINGFRRSGGGGSAEVRIVRTIKRRLSAKDILMGPNQDVKRRKITKRRKSSDVQVISEIIQPINMPLPQYIPVRTENNSTLIRSSFFSTSSSSSMKHEKQPATTSTTIVSSNKSSETTTASSIKMDTVINSPKKSISLYFGAKNRIENGEKFTIMAKRITFDGKEQFLLEWESSKVPTSNASNNNNNLAPLQQNE